MCVLLERDLSDAMQHVHGIPGRREGSICVERIDGKYEILNVVT